jgi:hypothetical protein
MPLSDLSLKEKIIRYDFEFKALSENLRGVVKEIHNLGASMRTVGILVEKLENMDQNIRDSFQRAHLRTDKIEQDLIDTNKKLKLVDLTHLAIYGKDGRGGLLFDVEDLKKFMYKSLGAFTIINLLSGFIISRLF